MKETFQEYKSVIEQNIIKFGFLYSGDIVSSKPMFFSDNRNNKEVSPKLIIDCIDDIYKKSMENMFNKSIEFIYNNIQFDEFNIDDIYDFINNLNIDYDYFFVSENIYQNKYVKSIINTSPFPEYFFKFYSNMYYSPLIEDNIVGETIFYLVKGGIQSLVYSLQNMDYKIKKKSHIIEYPFYYCSFISYKIILKNTMRTRDNKLNILLN